MFKILGAALLAAVTFGAGASAATLNGTFTVEAVNVTGLGETQSQATLDNFNTYFNAVGANADTFTYTGHLNFNRPDNFGDSTTITQWLDTGTGTSDEDLIFGALRLSNPDVFNPTATTRATFFRFTLNTAFPGADFVVRHDDGFAVYSGTTLIGGVLGPTSVDTTTVPGFGGGPLSFIYVAANGDPSIFEVSAVNVVPVPAALPLLLAGLGGLALLRRRKAA